MIHNMSIKIGFVCLFICLFICLFLFVNFFIFWKKYLFYNSSQVSSIDTAPEVASSSTVSTNALVKIEFAWNPVRQGIYCLLSPKNSYETFSYPGADLTCDVWMWSEIANNLNFLCIKFYDFMKRMRWTPETKKVNTALVVLVLSEDKIDYLHYREYTHIYIHTNICKSAFPSVTSEWFFLPDVSR